MIKKILGRTSVVLIFVFILACTFAETMIWGISGPQAPVNALTEYADPIRETEKCNATDELIAVGEIEKEEVNEFGTRLCSFKLTFNNLRSSQAIWVMAYRHEADVWQGTDEHEWIPLGLVEPGTMLDWWGYNDIFNEEDASGPTLLELDKAAGIYDLPECMSLRTDTDALEYMAHEIPSVCSDE